MILYFMASQSKKNNEKVCLRPYDSTPHGIPNRDQKESNSDGSSYF